MANQPAMKALVMLCLGDMLLCSCGRKSLPTPRRPFAASLLCTPDSPVCVTTEGWIWRTYDRPFEFWQVSGSVPFDVWFSFNLYQTCDPVSLLRWRVVVSSVFQLLDVASSHVPGAPPLKVLEFPQLQVCGRSRLGSLEQKLFDNGLIKANHRLDLGPLPQ